MAALRPGAALTIIGIGQSELRARLADHATAVLPLDLADAATAHVAIGRILDDLADLAATFWSPGAEPAEATHSLIHSWRCAAARALAAGQRPRFPWLPRETEFSHLLSVLPDLLLFAEVDPLRGERAAPIIATLEWCRRQNVAVVALLAEAPAPEPPWDRLLHDAHVVERPHVEPAAQRLIVPPALVPPLGSATERRMREALRATPDLAGLFEDEVTVSLGALGPTPRVDLLWREGRVVVELDGAEHERDPNYGADRHRDYELMVAGYLVLRLTNAEVALDLGRSLDKVRRVVDLRRGKP